MGLCWDDGKEDGKYYLGFRVEQALGYTVLKGSMNKGSFEIFSRHSFGGKSAWALNCDVEDGLKGDTRGGKRRILASN